MGWMKLPLRSLRALPMPLWLQGVFELGQAALISVALVVLPIAGVWVTGGFSGKGMQSAGQLAGQAWMVMHGVPLQLSFPAGVGGTSASTGVLHVVPLALTLLPFALAWRAGRRLARASYTDQLWQAILGALGAYAATSLLIASFSSNVDATVPLGAGTLIPLIAAGAGLVTGAYREAGAWSRLIGVDRAGWIARTSQHWRWAGSYLWSVLRSGFLALLVSLGLSAALFATAVGLQWAQIAAIYERLDAGIVGATVLTLSQLGFMPNLIIWTMAWASGSGFALGVDSSVSPWGSTLGPLPAIPVLGAIPAGALEYGYAALAVPLVAGILAGWWFFREGENHFDEWLEITLHRRWLSGTASTLSMGLLVGVTAAAGSGVLAWLSRASLGLGRFTELGPNPWAVMLWLGVGTALGSVIGYLAGPLLEREPRR